MAKKKDIKEVKGVGRPKAIIDWNEVGELLKKQCKVVEIASVLGISPDTLYLRCKEDNKMEFTVFSEQKKGEGIELLRAKQFEVAMSGDKLMLIWLGKQYLGQTDRQSTEHSGKIDGVNLLVATDEQKKLIENAG
jgi:hypothetical protein